MVVSAIALPSPGQRTKIQQPWKMKRETSSVAYKQKKKKKSQENVPKNAKILNYYKDFKSVILNMSKNKF